MQKITAIIFTIFMGLTLFSWSESITKNDIPIGFASQGKWRINNKKPITVSTKKEFFAALNHGGVIYIDGMIDLSDGMMVKNKDIPTALDDFVKSRTSGKYTYEQFVTAYSNSCSIDTDDSKVGKQGNSKLAETLWDLNHAYGDKIRAKIQSDTCIIGLGQNSGFTGGSLSIRDVHGVVLRNLVIQDGYDPFPHHESFDGYNAQHDAVSIINSWDVWLDHCTLRDTQEIRTVLTGGDVQEKWQTYDGLCDITSESKNITVSYCQFESHDKTMLIGSSDSEQIGVKRTITLCYNIFRNCGQRLPMVRLSNVHIYNNYFVTDSNTRYKSQYAVGVRYCANIISQNNYFEQVAWSFSGNEKKPGSVYSVDDIDKSINGKKIGQFTIAKKPLFDIPYSYNLLTASSVPDTLKHQAGAGILEVLVE